MGFDRRRRTDEGNRFDNVRVKRSLSKKVDLAERPRFLLKNFDELVANEPTLLFGIFNTFERGKECLAGIHVAKAAPKPFRKQLANAPRFVLSQETVINKHADEAFLDGAVD